MSILSSTNTGLSSIKSNIKKWLNENNISGCDINQTLEHSPYYTIDVINADVNLSGLKLSELPEYIVFNEIIGGNFICSYSNLSSMKGIPKKIGKNFDISFSKINSLDNAPLLVDKDFVACGQPFKEEIIRAQVKVTCKIYV